MQERAAASAAAIPSGEARLVYFSRRWQAHRLITEWMVRLFTDMDPGNPGNMDRFKQFCTCPTLHQRLE